MRLSNSPKVQWGKLTSLNPNFYNISLLKNPSSLVFTSPLQENNDQNSSSSQYKCQIYQDKQECFISYTGDTLAIQVNNKAVKEGKTFKLYSGDGIKITIKKKKHEMMTLEFIFSAELSQVYKETLKRDREENEELTIAEKKIKFQEDFKNEAICNICWKMIYECVSVVPCLHSFCMVCFMRHLRKSQECPECGERFVEFRKNIFLNNLIEDYHESGYQRDNSPEECRKIDEKLNTRRVFARFEYANGDVYEGEWKKCRRDGRGKIHYGRGHVYEGDWRNGYIEGKGKGVFADGHVYVGDFKNNKIEGKGKMEYNNGAIYEGDWKENKMEGKGKMRSRDGDVYEGDWKENIMEGKGRFISKNKFVYEGDFEGGKLEGKGKIIEKNGNIYEGDCRNNKKSGKGKMIYATGDVYEGYWRKNEREGRGRMICANGRIYEGFWRNNKREGKGRMVYPNGDVYEVKWRNNKMKGSQRKIEEYL